MQWRKAFRDYLPSIMIVYTGVCDRYIIIAPPVRFEWVPTSELVKPDTEGPILSAVALMSARNSELLRFVN